MRSIESDGTVGNDTHCVDSGWKFEMVAVYKERARLSNRITYRTNNLLHHSPYSEGYFTTVGAILCVLFWTVQGIVYSLRKGVFKTSDIPLLVINQRKFRLF